MKASMITSSLQARRASADVFVRGSVGFAPDGKLLATANHDCSVRVWDLGSGKEKWRLQGHGKEARFVVFAPDGLSVVSGGEDGTVRVWNVATGEERAVLKMHSGGVWSVTYSPDGRWLATAGVDVDEVKPTTSGGGTKLYDLRTKKTVVLDEFQDWPMLCVAFSPDGKLVASSSLEGKVNIWRVPSDDKRPGK